MSNLKCKVIGVWAEDMPKKLEEKINEFLETMPHTSIHKILITSYSLNHQDEPSGAYVVALIFYENNKKEIS